MCAWAEYAEEDSNLRRYMFHLHFLNIKGSAAHLPRGAANMHEF